MKFSTFHLFQVPPGGSAQDITLQEVEMMKYVDELGFDGVWIGEHHFGGEGVAGSSSVLLSSVAAATKHIRLGSGISVLSLTDPIRNAEDYATLDVISGGRVNFGVGIGNRAAESLVWGIPQAELRGRFEEALQVILGAWTEDEFNYEGKYYQAHHLTLEPKPIQKPHPPLFEAASSPATWERCGRDGIIPLVAPQGPSPQLQERRELFQKAARAAGRSQQEIAGMLSEIAYMRYSHVAETDAKARELGEGAFDRVKQIKPAADLQAAKTFGFEMPAGFLERLTGNQRQDWKALEEDKAALFGSPEHVVENIHRMREAQPGLDHIMLWEVQGDLPKESVRKSFKLFAEKVIPHFK
ncbi:MAG: LLM class flavin-dependent oxidoreductase [Dehalococcoidia bacterium]|nr:LLM class flavin-dependent oxidoreductase [Dehalococcoidia bacterium]